MGMIINSHVGEVKEELEYRIPSILNALGLEAQGNAITEISNMGAVDTGRLRNSITYVTAHDQGQPNTQGGDPALPSDYAPHGSAEDDKVYIGTNVEYAPYIELGTSKMPGRPFLKSAITNYQQDYKRIIKDGLK